MGLSPSQICPQSPSKWTTGQTEEDQESLGQLRPLPVLVRNKSKINYFRLLPFPSKMVSFVCPLPPPSLFIKLSFLLSKQLSMMETPPG